MKYTLARAPNVCKCVQTDPSIKSVCIISDGFSAVRVRLPGAISSKQPRLLSLFICLCLVSRDLFIPEISRRVSQVKSAARRSSHDCRAKIRHQQLDN
jgi:hypothetical protein